MQKSILQPHFSSSMQNTARKNTKYSRKETILKIAKNGHLARAREFENRRFGPKNKNAKKPC